MCKLIERSLCILLKLINREPECVQLKNAELFFLTEAFNVLQSVEAEVLIGQRQN